MKPTVILIAGLFSLIVLAAVGLFVIDERGLSKMVAAAVAAVWMMLIAGGCEYFFRKYMGAENREHEPEQHLS